MKRKKIGRFFDKSLLVVTDPTGTRLHLIGLTVPIFFENVCANLIGLLQTSMAAYYQDGYFVLITSVPNQLVNLVLSLLAMVSVGLSVLLSIRLGRGEREESRRLLGSALYVIFGLSLVVCAMAIGFARPFIQWMGLDAQSGQFEYAVLYFRLRLAAYAATYWVGVFTAALRCYGYPKIGFAASLVSNAVNAISTYAAMFLFRVPPASIVPWLCGITLYSEGIKVAIVCVFFAKRKIPVSFRFDKRQAADIFRYGFPASVANIAYTVSQTVTGAILVGLGDDVYKTKQYVSQIVYFVYVMGLSIGQANSVMVGREFGMDDKERADRLHRQNLRCVVLINVALSLLLALFSESLMRGLFNADDRISELSRAVFFIDIAVEAGRGMNHVGQNGLNAVGDVLFTTVVSVFSCWTCSVGGAYLFAVVLHGGLTGMWCAFAADELFRGFLYYTRWRRGKWKTHEFDRAKVKRGNLS